jgi:hypothetical protein
MFEEISRKKWESLSGIVSRMFSLLQKIVIRTGTGYSFPFLGRALLLPIFNNLIHRSSGRLKSGGQRLMNE